MAIPSELSSRLKLPLLIAPMFLVSTVELVVGACRNGAIGSFPTVGAIKSVEPVQALLRRLSEEYWAAANRRSSLNQLAAAGERMSA